jgi:ribosomal protein L31
MATYPFLDSVIRAQFQWNDGAGLFGSRLFFEASTGPYPTADLLYLATQLSALWGTNMKQDVHPNFSLVKVTCTDLTNATGAVATWQGSIAGTSGGSPVSSNCAVDIRSILKQHYRGGHPVFHHPPSSTSNLAGSRAWGGTYCNGVATHFQAFINAVAALSSGTITTTQHVVPLHYKPGNTFAQVTLSFPTSYLVPTRLGSMRSRLVSAV